MKQIRQFVAFMLLLSTTSLVVYAQENNGPVSHDYIDLELPSGTLWATCNIGANSPEEYGDHFAWGETTPKDNYSWSTYHWIANKRLTKYCTNKNLGQDDYLIELELEDDAATVLWGKEWKTPIHIQYLELMDASNCIWDLATVNGVNGYKVISTRNGKSIFLPASGFYNEEELSNQGSAGYYWTSVLGQPQDEQQKDESFYAAFLAFQPGRFALFQSPRSVGKAIRAVRTKNE